jgi:ferrous iron transport protein A
MKTNFNFTTGQECPLSELAPSQAGRVLRVDTSAPAGRRLLELGFVPQTPLRVLRRAPLGDPAVYELRGYRICLRDEDASRVQVRIQDQA